MARKKKTISDPQRDVLVKMIGEEYNNAKSNRSIADADLDAMLDMIELRRTEKDYEWRSDIYYPVFASIFLTECSQWAGTMFGSRDYAEVLLEGDGPQDEGKCRAYKKLINRTLNRRGLHFFQKYMRFRGINALCGDAWLVCGWDKKVEVNIITQPVPTIVVDPVTGQRNIIEGTRETPVKKIHHDFFDCDVADPRNVFMDNSYAYSAQDKDYVIIRSERSLAWLRDNAEKMGYEGLEALESVRGDGETETTRETTNARDPQTPLDQPHVGPKFDVLDRYGKVWAIIVERNDLGAPTAIRPGVDDQGNPLEKAELVEAILTVVHTGGASDTLIRFVPSPFMDTKGQLYRPLIRGRCYVHPTSDMGMSDAKYSRELQVGINDSYNLGMDRAQLATLPTFVVKKYAADDDLEINIQPEGTIPVEDVNDIRELSISGDIRGMLEQIQMLTTQMQQVNAVFPTTLGDMPVKTSTTATAVAGADSRSNIRANYKELTVEHTALTELYWMIGQMSHQFMEMETGLTILGDDLRFFDPDGDYSYKPITGAIEAESNKWRKIQGWDQFIGRIGTLAQAIPALVPLIAYATAKITELMGDDFRLVAPMINKLANSQPALPPGGAPGAGEIGPGPGGATSNQNGTPMSGGEMMARGM